MTLKRVPRRTLRKLTKPVRLWLNAYRFEQSAQEIEHLENLRVAASLHLMEQHRQQVRLRLQRAEIVRS